jgi:hypothetical protein
LPKAVDNDREKPWFAPRRRFAAFDYRQRRECNFKKVI